MIVLPILGAGLVGQLLKVIFHSLRQRRWRPGLMGDFESFPNLQPLLGGSLFFQIGEASGWNSPQLAIVMGFTGIVIYDSSGVKRAAGMQARLLNRLGPRQVLNYSINELLGQSPFRTWLTAFVGILLGILVERAWVALISLSW
jgi:acid phosphatase family membrane protein YuiD